jgi:hypothetical protein
MDFAVGPPCDEDEWALIREHGMARDWMLSGRPYELDHEAGRVVYLSPADRALDEFIDTVDRHEHDAFAMVMAAALFLRRWLRDHPTSPLPLLWLVGLILLVLRQAIARDPGRPDDGAVVHVPSAPLVRPFSLDSGPAVLPHPGPRGSPSLICR